MTEKNIENKTSTKETADRKVYLKLNTEVRGGKAWVWISGNSELKQIWKYKNVAGESPNFAGIATLEEMEKLPSYSKELAEGETYIEDQWIGKANEISKITNELKVHLNKMMPKFKERYTPKKTEEEIEL